MNRYHFLHDFSSVKGGGADSIFSCCAHCLTDAIKMLRDDDPHYLVDFVTENGTDITSEFLEIINDA